VIRREYLHELSRAAVSVSPFGHGEICLRDFETFLAGAALVKPDMSHVETWPPFYVDGETYVAHRWNLDDLEDAIRGLLASPRREEVARGGQDVYRRYLIEREGHEAFGLRVALLMQLGRRFAGRRAAPELSRMSAQGA
jgi:hypothetical protein